jgi:ubiquitin-protein ligase
LFLWEALIQGPEGTPFEGGIFPAELKFPKDYPLAPPTMRFTCEMWHPNGESWQQSSKTRMAKEEEIVRRSKRD